MNRKAQHGTIVLPDQFFERCSVALLSGADKPRVIHTRCDRRRLPARRKEAEVVHVGRRAASFAYLRHDHFPVRSKIQLVVCPSHHDQRHVVFTGTASGEILGRAQHGKYRRTRGGTARELCYREQAFYAKIRSGQVAAFGNSIGIAEQRVTR